MFDVIEILSRKLNFKIQGCFSLKVIFRPKFFPRYREMVRFFVLRTCSLKVSRKVNWAIVRQSVRFF